MQPRRSRLVALAGDAARPSPAGAAAPQRSAGPSRREWALVALLVLALAALAFAALRARHLEARVGTLGAELARSRALVEVHREHLRAVRGGVAAVREELAALEALAAAEPEHEAPAP